MEVPSSTRRANRWLLAALVIFCIGLCVFCLLWMRQKVAADGGRVYPPISSPSPAQASCQTLVPVANVT